MGGMCGDCSKVPRFPHKTAKDVFVGRGEHVTVELKFPQVISSLPILLLKFPEADFS